MKQGIYITGATNYPEWEKEFEKAEYKARTHFKSFAVVNPVDFYKRDFYPTTIEGEIKKCHYLLIIDDYDGKWKSSPEVNRDIALSGKYNLKVIHLSILE